MKIVQWHTKVSNVFFIHLADTNLLQKCVSFGLCFRSRCWCIKLKSPIVKQFCKKLIISDIEIKNKNDFDQY